MGKLFVSPAATWKILSDIEPPVDMDFGDAARVVWAESLHAVAKQIVQRHMDVLGLTLEGRRAEADALGIRS